MGLTPRKPPPPSPAPGTVRPGSPNREPRREPPFEAAELLPESGRWRRLESQGSSQSVSREPEPAELVLTSFLADSEMEEPASLTNCWKLLRKLMLV